MLCLSFIDWRFIFYLKKKSSAENIILFTEKELDRKSKFYCIEDFIGKSTSTLNSSISFLSYICGSVGNLETSKQMHNLGVE